MKTLCLPIIFLLAISAVLASTNFAFAQSQSGFPHQIAPPPPNKIGCYRYTTETGWVSVPCANASLESALGSMGPLPTQNSTKRLDIELGISPGKILVDPNANLIYVADRSGNSITIVSGLTNKSIGTITVGKSPSDIVVNPHTNMIYVSNINSQSVSVISESTNKVVATIQVGDGPSSIAINTRTNMIYVANVESNTVSVINGTTNSVVSTLHLCNLWGTNFAVDESTNTIYLTCTGSQGGISVISGAENKVVNTIAIGRDPNRLAFNPRTDMLYTANNGDDTVSVVSALDNKLKDTIHVKPFPNFVAVNPDTNTVYVTADSYKNHTLSVISGATDKILAIIDVDMGAQNIAIDSSDNIIYVPNYVAETLSVISGNTNSVIDTIPVGPNPSFIAINNITKTVYISNFYGSISVIPFSNINLQDAPEFSLAIPVLLIGITSLIVFYRIKIRN